MSYPTVRNALAIYCVVICCVVAGLLASGCGGGKYDDAWFVRNTVSRRQPISVPGSGAVLNASGLKKQLVEYDPGSLMRCDAHLDADYQEAIDEIGGVSWGYHVPILEDESKPRFLKGYEKRAYWDSAAMPSAEGGGGVEIAESDIVGISTTTALFLSRTHGVFLVSLEGEKPVFTCATKLPGQVGEFYYHKGHLIVMTANGWGNTRKSYLLHFEVSGKKIAFVENVELGNVSILDSRRFNDRLVVYTDLTLEQPQPEASGSNDSSASSPGSSGAAAAERAMPYPAANQAKHRELRVLRIEAKLQEELRETLLDTSKSEQYLLHHRPAQDTPINTIVHESNTFGQTMWASDRYFVVTKQISQTWLAGWKTRTYDVCTASHDIEVPYTYCWTRYEERPNPNYKPADNSGGDRACKGTTLSSCLRKVSREASKTIQVPVEQKCEARVRTEWVCDKWEQRSDTYPTYDNKLVTRLYIYEYFDDGFVKLDDKVKEITTPGLEELDMEASVEKLTTSDEEFDLLIDGAVQTLQFQNGFLYVISQGNLQVYAMAENSLVRTKTMQLVNDTLESSLFTSDKLFLSDFGYTTYSRKDHSTLKVVDLSNPGFPKLVSKSHELPGGHRSILPTDLGILTIGTVQNFEPGIRSVLKLGLFADPYATEQAYLIIGTDLMVNRLGDERSHFYSGATRRLFLPYAGNAEQWWSRRNRIGVSQLTLGSIDSEGAMDVPELPSRVRPLPNPNAESMLSFAENSIYWLVDKGAPKGDRWEARPVLEYYTPVALYRLNDEHLWVEVLRLGNRCKLHFALRGKINKRKDNLTTEPFDCDFGHPWAFENNIVFSAGSGVSFTEQGELTLLEKADIEALAALRQQRQVCLFTTQLVEDTSIDFENPPSLSSLHCYDPEQYEADVDAMNDNSPRQVPSPTPTDPLAAY